MGFIVGLPSESPALVLCTGSCQKVRYAYDSGPVVGRMLDLTGSEVQTIVVA